MQPGEAWIAVRDDLRVAVDRALRHDDIRNALDEERIPHSEARAAVLDDPAVLARTRSDRVAFSADRDRIDEAFIGARPGDPPESDEIAPFVFAAGALTGYTVLFAMALPHLPVALGIFCGIGLLSAALRATGYVVRAAPSVVDWLFSLANSIRASPATRAWRHYVQTEIVLPELRQFISDKRKPVYHDTLTVRGVIGLYTEDEYAPTVVTAAAHQLRRVLSRSDTGAIALAGHRGVGKTTTIHRVAEGAFGDEDAAVPLAIIASAPARYEARDFVLHLHALLCHEVIARVREILRPDAGPRDTFATPHRTVRRQNRTVAELVSWTGMVVAAGIVVVGGAAVFGSSVPEYLNTVADKANALVRNLPDSASTVIAGESGYRQLALVATLVLCFLVSLTLLSYAFSLVTASMRAMWRFRRWRKASRLRVLLKAAERQLRRIRFLQTHTAGWSGKLTLPFKTDLGWTRSVQRAEQPLTYPEVVNEFRTFAEAIAVLVRESGIADRMVIAIDELDKIAEPDKVQEFLNDIKTIFGIPGCQFLVSVSDDAIATFERRGIPARDAFDSAFSDMLRLENFTADESRRWLGRRVLGIPEQFMYLCHCFSGGLPRDLRRYAIEMMDIAEQEPGLGAVTAELVNRELSRKAAAFAGVTGNLEDSPARSDFLAELVRLPECHESGDLLALAKQLTTPEHESPELVPLRRQSGCFVLFCATVLELFTDELDERGLRGNPGAEPSLLATARRQMAVDPELAWRLLLDFRAACGLPAKGSA